MSDATPVKKKANLLVRGLQIVLGILVCLLVLGAIVGEDEDASTPVGASSQDQTPAQSASSKPKVEDRAKAAQEAAKMIPQEKLPDGAPDAPVVGFCLTEACEVSRASFDRRDWPKAWGGDYQAQRNVAYCRSTGCDGAVQSNKAEACAWRSIILVAHVGKTDDTDNNNLKIACGDLDEAEVAVAITNAEQIYQKIYSKPMPRTKLP